MALFQAFTLPSPSGLLILFMRLSISLLPPPGGNKRVKQAGGVAARRIQGPMSTLVPGLINCRSSLISASVSAMQPSVQLNL